MVPRRFDSRHGRSTTGVVIVLLAIAAAVAVVLLLRNGWDRPDNPTGDPTAAFQLTRAALAATENLETDEANERWTEVLQIRGDDLDALQNAALNRVSTVEQLSAQLYDGSLSAADKAAARERLPTAIQQARSAIDDYAGQSGKPQLVSWMQAVVDMQEANQLPAAEQQRAQTEAFLKLADNIDDTPSPLILMGPLIDLALLLDDAVEGLPPSVAQRYPDVLYSAADKYPRNLFLAIETMIRLIKAHDPRATDQVDRVEQLTQPLAGLLEKYATTDLTFIAKQTTAIRDAIAADNWSLAAILAQQIRNVLTPTEVVRTDRKRANPNALDLLSFQGLRKLAAASAADNAIAMSTAPLQFQPQSTDTPISATALCIADFNLDGTPDILSVHQDQLTLSRRNNDGWETYASTTIAADMRGVVVADLFMVDAGEPSRIRKPAAADLDVAEAAAESKRHETFPSAIVFGDSGIQIFRIDGRSESEPDKRLLPPASPAGLQDITKVTAVQPGDLDADGDLDLVIATANDGLRIWINRGNMTFFEVTQFSSLAPADDPVTAMSIGDIDRDLDLDILLTHGKSGRVAVLENLLHLQFRWKLLDGVEPLAAPALVSLEEIDGDASWDVVAAGQQGLHIGFTQTVDAGLVDVTQDASLEQPSTTSLLADLNNDSWLDWISIGEQTTAAYSLGPWGQKPLPTEADLPPASTALAACDLNGDGLLDLVGIADSTIWTALNTTADAGHYIDVRFRGKNDNNENSGRINHYGIGTVLELRFGPHYRAQVITQRTTHFGIDGFDSVDTVRAILPNGITQNTVSPSVDTVLDEEQTLKGSCPYLYAWDGEKFAFVTDCLWAAPLGLQLADGVVAPDRPWEYLKVPGRFVAPRDGEYELRITEELWEAAYFDHVELTAVDHPADVEIFTNEKVGPGSIAEHTIFAFDPATLRPTKTALDTQGRDVSATLAADDDTYVKGFDYRLRQGLCPPHWIDLDLGTVAVDDKILLVLTGWILPTDTSLNIQIDQNPALPAVQPPQVLVPDGDDWRVAIPFMGFPGGKTKTIVVDLTGHVNADDPRVRIRTSAQIYWDRAAVAINPPDQPLEQHTLTLQSANLTWHGFSRRLNEGDNQPETYDYSDADSTPRWPPLRGPITGYGDVLPLLQSWDDRMIVMGAGDEIQMRFSVPGKPLADGWKRDFVLHCVGWDKDADLNTITGQQFGPLPFRAMTAYPPGPEQAAAAGEVWQKNASQLTRQQRFRDFWTRFP